MQMGLGVVLSESSVMGMRPEGVTRSQNASLKRAISLT
jgi:hypothetical protein